MRVIGRIEPERITAGDAIALADSLCPNTYEGSLKIAWLRELDGMIHREIFSWHEDVPAESNECFDEQTLLIVPTPYSSLYADYLMAQIYQHNGENEPYTNAEIRFNSSLSAYADWYNRTHMPKQPHLNVGY